jgi:polynucleotide 5'-kinase involved in rRNA processing
MLEGCSEHVLELDHIGIHGVRLGCGQRLHGAPFDELGTHVEVYGSTLLVVTDHDLDEQTAGEALNLAHATKLHLVSPTAYDGLVSSFVRGTGEDFGIGVVKGIDFLERKATFLNNAVAPAPVKSVRIGSLRIDETGKETGETKPWAV